MTEPNKTVELTGEIATPKETLLEIGRAHV